MWSPVLFCSEEPSLQKDMFQTCFQSICLYIHILQAPSARAALMESVSFLWSLSQRHLDGFYYEVFRGPDLWPWKFQHSVILYSHCVRVEYKNKYVYCIFFIAPGCWVEIVLKLHFMTFQENAYITVYTVTICYFLKHTSLFLLS